MFIIAGLRRRIGECRKPKRKKENLVISGGKVGAFGQFLEEFFLFGGKGFWHANLNFHEEGASTLFFVEAFIGKSKFLAALNACGNGQFDVAGDGWAFQLATKCRFPRRYLEFLNDIEVVGATFGVDDIETDAQIRTVDILAFELENSLIFCTFGNIDFNGSRLTALRNGQGFWRRIQEFQNG